MDKKIKIYIALFVLIVAFIIYTDANKAKPINWTPSYVADHKLPYGTYVLNNNAGAIELYLSLINKFGISNNIKEVSFH